MSELPALLLDIGNTRLKWGLAHGSELRRTGSVTLERLHRDGSGVLTTRIPQRIDCIYASNVAGQSLGTRIAGVLGVHCNRDVHFVRSAARAFGVTNSYRQPRRLGVDRWVALIAARHAFRGAVCVVDAGTAVTIDALDREGRHVGGQILPGLQLMCAALADDTSDLPRVQRAPKASSEKLGPFARSTGGAIYYGSLGAVCGAVERAGRQLRAAGMRPRVILTGGDASRILAALDGRAEHRPHLVLEGLAVIAQGAP